MLTSSICKLQITPEWMTDVLIGNTQRHWMMQETYTL